MYLQETLSQDAMADLKASVKAHLIALNIKRIDLYYNGCGDSGLIDSTETMVDEMTNDESRPMLSTIITENEQQLSLANFLENTGYQVLEAHFPGWEISDGEVDGADGQIVLNDTGLIEIHHDARYIATDTRKVLI